MTTSHTGTPPTTPDLIYGFSVVVPAYNEGIAVGDVVRRIIETMTSTGQPFEVIVVDDGKALHADGDAVVDERTILVGATVVDGLFHAFEED